MSFQSRLQPLLTAPRVQPGREAGQKPRILLLQGPVGPFFAELRAHLARQGCDVDQIAFNAGDRFFAPGAQPFRAGLKAWSRWLSLKLITGSYDQIVMFGADRPAHRIARRVAEDFGVPVLTLEEGYIRPGLITAEWGGNNAASPLAARLPGPDWVGKPAPMPARFRYSMANMVGFSAAYFTARRLLSRGQQHETFHRSAPLLAESRAWIRNFARWLVGRRREARKMARLIAPGSAPFYLLPLQVAADCNMRNAALGWTSERLIRESLASFAKTAPAKSRIVFKIHPMERGHNRLNPLILAEAKALGIAARVVVVETGSLGELARHAAGMITITSSSGLSALHHGVPLMVIGHALYAHPALATCAQGCPDFDRFWRGGFTAPAALRAGYLGWVRDKALQVGDFYAPTGRKAACAAIAQVLAEGPNYEELVWPSPALLAKTG